jgi:hypothetical protein
MSSSAIGPGNATGNYANGSSPTDNEAGEMVRATESAPSQSETPPPSSIEDEGPNSPNFWNAPEDYDGFSPIPYYDRDDIDPIPGTGISFLDTGGASDTEVTYEEILENPDVLPEAGTQGVEVTGMDLTLDSGGNLSEDSKQEVNELVGNMSDRLGGVEVVANAYMDENGNEKVSLHLTSGDEHSAMYYPKENTVYSVHTHSTGSTTPSLVDRINELDGAEDAIVPTDGIPGNEDGSVYNIYA